MNLDPVSRMPAFMVWGCSDGIHLPVKGSKHPGRVAAIRSQRAPFLITQWFDFRNPLGAGKEACLANCPNEGVVCAWRLQILKEHHFRHKTLHLNFKYGVPFLLILQIAGLIYLHLP